MTAAHTGRYSKYIRPISIIFDLLVLSCLCLFFFEDLNLNNFYYILYQTITWGVIAFFVKFYEVFRFTTPVEIVSKLVKQSVLFLLVIIAFFPFSKQALFSGKAIVTFVFSSFFLITIFKILLFYYLKQHPLIGHLKV